MEWENTVKTGEQENFLQKLFNIPKRKRVLGVFIFNTLKQRIACTLSPTSKMIFLNALREQIINTNIDFLLLLYLKIECLFSDMFQILKHYLIFFYIKSRK